jgi:hypothetical protein
MQKTCIAFEVSGWMEQSKKEGKNERIMNELRN